VHLDRAPISCDTSMVIRDVKIYTFTNKKRQKYEKIKNSFENPNGSEEMVKKEIEARTIMYVQQIAHLHITIDQINARLKDLADNYKDVRYAYIVHDKDMVEDTNKAVEPHIHVMVQVGKSNNWALSKWADDLFSDTAEHVQKWKG